MAKTSWIIGEPSSITVIEHHGELMELIIWLIELQTILNNCLMSPVRNPWGFLRGPPIEIPPDEPLGNFNLRSWLNFSHCSILRCFEISMNKLRFVWNSKFEFKIIFSSQWNYWASILRTVRGILSTNRLSEWFKSTQRIGFKRDAAQSSRAEFYKPHNVTTNKFLKQLSDDYSAIPIISLILRTL